MATKAITSSVPNFRMGSRQVFLPNFTLTFLRTPTAPPNFASFIVPLNINKLDLRDYLWNAYGVRVLGVRSFIQQQKVTDGPPKARRPIQGYVYRARAIKKMMVEMDKPFVWPEMPENLDAWDKTIFDAAAKDQVAYQRSFSPQAKLTADSQQRLTTRTQAKPFLKGGKQWEPPRRNSLVWDESEPSEEIDDHIQIGKDSTPSGGSV